MRIPLIYPMITDFKQTDDAFGSSIRCHCFHMKKIPSSLKKFI